MLAYVNDIVKLQENVEISEYKEGNTQSLSRERTSKRCRSPFLNGIRELLH